LQFEIGNKYDIVVNGQIWSFIYDGADAEDEEFHFITWSTGEEESHSKEELMSGIMELDTLKVAGIVYPRGKSEEDQYQALRSVMLQPTYRFAGMVVPRAMVLSGAFAPDKYIDRHYDKYNKEYMGFEYDPDKHLLNISSSDPDAIVPSWILERLRVSGVMRIDQGQKKTTFIVTIEE